MQPVAFEVQQSWRYRSWRSQGYRTEPPLYSWPRLVGRWIENAVFGAGQRVRINGGQGRLTITAE